MDSTSVSTPTGDEALERLRQGNERFLAGAAKFPTMQKEILADLVKGQHPYATILSCSDSRVPPELVFDAGFGELFIIRVAGNVLSPEVAGSIQDAVSAHERKTKVRWTADAEMASVRGTAHADHSRRSSLHLPRQPRCQRPNG